MPDKRSIKVWLYAITILGVFALMCQTSYCKKSGGTGGLPAGKKSGLFLISIGDKSGYIDRKGQIVINPQFGLANPFYDGLASVAVGANFGYINESGNIVINPQFELTDSFAEGLAAMKIGGVWGFIDKSGKIVINPQFARALNFSEGLAQVAVGEDMRGNPRWGYINKSGKYVINPQFDGAQDFSGGVAGASLGRKWGYIDKSGKYVINPQFESAFPFTEGLAAVSLGGKIGYVDKSGKYVINPQFDNAKSFSEGLAAVLIGGKWGYINEKGTYVINPQFRRAERFSEGRASVSSDNDVAGYIDKSGIFVVNPVFGRCDDFSDGLGRVWVSGYCAYIDESGKFVWDMDFKEGSLEEFKQAKEHIARRNFSGAKQACQLALRLDSQNKEAELLLSQIDELTEQDRLNNLLSQAERQLDYGNYDRAIELYDQVLQKSPQNQAAISLKARGAELKEIQQKSRNYVQQNRQQAPGTNYVQQNRQETPTASLGSITAYDLAGIWVINQQYNYQLRITATGNSSFSGSYANIPGNYDKFDGAISGSSITVKQYSVGRLYATYSLRAISATRLEGTCVTRDETFQPVWIKR